MNRKVYLLEPFTGLDTLLYDFDLALGDTLPPAYNNIIPDNVVTGIDSVLVGAQYHRRFWLSANGTTDYAAIIEGIGSTFGLTFPLYPPFEFFNTLMCVTIDGQPVYPDTSQACPLISGVRDVMQNERITVYPNPAADKAIVYFPSAADGTTGVVLNTAGFPVAVFSFRNGSAALFRGQLNPGMYFIRIRNSHGREYVKKIAFQ